MPNDYFKFKHFTIHQERSSFKVGTDGVLLGACCDVSDVRTVLDIGTGTGLIALMLAQRSEAVITAIEPDRDSFEQARLNIESSKWSNRIKVLNTTLQDFNSDGKFFDLIITNPPWFTGSLKNPDPRKAAARHDDTLPADDLLKGVSELLDDKGCFQIILPYVEGTLFIAQAQEFGLYCNRILKIRPLLTSEIKRMILTFSRHRKKPNEKFLTIEKNKRHEFTKDYIDLTKDFYLMF